MYCAVCKAHHTNWKTIMISTPQIDLAENPTPNSGGYINPKLLIVNELFVCPNCGTVRMDV